MSARYKKGSDVPMQTLINRLDEIADIIASGKTEKLTLSIPAQVDSDADLVLGECARRLQLVEDAHVEAAESKNFW